MFRPLRILVSTPKVGGIGGMQRSLFEVTKALNDCQIDVIGTNIVPSGFYPGFEHVSVVDLYQAIAAKSLRPKEYDIYIQYRAEGTFYFPGKYCSPRMKLIIPSGNFVGKIEHNFDYVINEAKDGAKYLRDQKKNVVLPPPVTRFAEFSRRVDHLPEKFFLTVFNPYTCDRYYEDGYKPAKGYDVLYEVAPMVDIPIVWVYSHIPGKYTKNIKKVSNIVYQPNISQGETAYLYEKCLAYVCFSREESFGFSIAEAFLYGRPVVTRNLGAATLFDKGKTTQYDSVDDLKNKLNELNRVSHSHVAYDLEVFSQESFHAGLTALLRRHEAQS